VGEELVIMIEGDEDRDDDLATMKNIR